MTGKVDVLDITKLIQLENGYLNYLNNLKESVRPEKLPKAIMELDDLTEARITDLLITRYQYDEETIPPAWVLGSPVFLYLKKRLKTLREKRLSEEKLTWDKFKDYVKNIPDKIWAAGENIIDFFLHLPANTINFILEIPGKIIKTCVTTFNFIKNVCSAIVKFIKDPIGSVKRIIDIVNKGVDVIDDLINALRNAKVINQLSQTASRGIIGGVNIFLHGYNGIKGFSEAYEAVTETNTGNTLFADIIDSTFGKIKEVYDKAGLGERFLIILAGLLSLPITLPAWSALSLGNIVTEFCKGFDNLFFTHQKNHKSFINRLTRFIAGVAKGLFGTAGVALGILFVIGGIVTLPVTLLGSAVLMLANFVTEYCKNLHLFNATKKVSKSAKIMLTNYKEEMIAEKEDKIFEDDVYTKLHTFGEKKYQHKQLKKEVLDTERDVGFAAAEVGTGSLVLAGAVITFAIGAFTVSSIATLGIAAAVVGGVAVGAGILLKTFQFIDEVYDNKPTKFLRESFTSIANWFKGKKPDPKKQSFELKPLSSMRVIQRALNMTDKCAFQKDIEKGLNTRTPFVEIKKNEAKTIQEFTPKSILGGSKTIKVNQSQTPLFEDKSIIQNSWGSSSQSESIETQFKMDGPSI